MRRRKGGWKQGRLSEREALQLIHVYRNSAYGTCFAFFTGEPRLHAILDKSWRDCQVTNKKNVSIETDFAINMSTAFKDGKLTSKTATDMCEHLPVRDITPRELTLAQDASSLFLFRSIFRQSFTIFYIYQIVQIPQPRSFCIDFCIQALSLGLTGFDGGGNMTIPSRLCNCIRDFLQLTEVSKKTREECEYNKHDINPQRKRVRTRCVR